MATAQLYLASRSPRRAELLAQIGITADFSLLSGAARETDETPRPREDPQEYVKRLARTKAALAWHRLTKSGAPLLPVLAADTAVALTQEIFGKPRDVPEARRMLAQLSGRQHEVFTAVALRLTHDMEVACSRSVVRFRVLTPEEIDRYIASGEPFDKAGAYGIQGRAAAFVSHLEGSYSGVMGLPLFETSALLARAGIFVI
ncbi:dTTP/UTP pyrophosphatase [Burkholderiales bacterium]|nr:MAG: septum formation inhibitor Maf [Burkholderiales bacterium]CAG0989073.1 dTTP/UTP pyrophosphatase [Burkholderiales bacterium]